MVKYALILLVIFIFAFSDFISFLPVVFQNNKLAENLKIQEARAAATYQAAGTFTSGGAVSISPLWPAHQAGDVALLFVETANQAITLTTPNGFVEVANSPQFTGTAGAAGGTRLGVYWARATSGSMPAPVIAATTNHAVAQILTFRGVVNTGNPWDITAGAITTPASTTSSFPTVTTTIAGDLIVLAAAVDLDSNSTAVWSAWTNVNLIGITEQVDRTVNTGAGGGLGIATATKTIAGATGASTGTHTSSITTQMTIALKPQPNSPPTISISQPDGVGDTVNVGDLYNITYTLSDPDDVVTAAFYYDTDNIGLNGTVIIGACATAPEGSGVTCSWNTTGIAPGSYYVYGITSDGVNPQVSAYSSGMITINAVLPNATGFTNNTEGTLTDGGRSSQQITVSGTNFGTVADGSQANCSGGIGTGCIRFIVGGNATVVDADISAWSNSSITFTINANLASYGGTASLQVVSSGFSDATPLDFYIYPNITSASANNGQIGDAITVSGDHFGVAVGTITINTKIAAVGTWTETGLTIVKISGQEGAANINGKIQITRADAKNSNQYPAGNFTILAPSVTGSNPASATTGQINFLIEFSGQGIDTDIGAAPTLKLTKGQPANCVASSTCILGTSYINVLDYKTVSARFDLTGAATGYWKLVIVNMDGQYGSFGNEVNSGFNITALAPVVYGIDPGSGLNTENNKIINYISGSNFQSGATVQLTHTALTPIDQLNPFAYNSGNGRLENGSFNLTGQTENLWWNIVVTNPDLQSGSYGNETSEGFEIKLSKPSNPTNLSQSKTQAGAAVAVGEGVGGQTNVYLRMDITGGLTGALNPYTPQVEVKQVGTPFDGLPGSISSGSQVIYDGITPVSGWVNVIGLQDGASYHWRARSSNSAGQSAWAPFGGNTDSDSQPSDTDVYIDNTPPEIYQNTIGDNACAGAAINITDLSATVKWKTSDDTSGGLNPPAPGPYATAQVDYKKSIDVLWSYSAIFPRNDNHQIDLTGLVPSTTYLFRMRSKDAAGNEKIYEDAVNCKFNTTSTRPIKTVEFFILQETAQNIGVRISKDFGIYIPESPGANVSVKSAFFEISGVTSADAMQRVNVELKRRATEGEAAIFDSPGTSYGIDSTGTITPFTILFDALNPNAGDGNQNMANITAGALNYYYTLFLNGNNTPISVFSAKLIITYSYAQ